MHALRKLTISETRLLLRDLPAAFFGIVFPSLLMVIFGLIPSFNDHVKDLDGESVLEVYLPIVITFGLTMLAVNAVPSAIASYREKGVLRRLRTTPIKAQKVLAAQLIGSLCLSAVALGLLMIVACGGFGVHLPDNGPSFVLAVLLTAAAVFSLGLVIAALAPSNSAATASGMVLFFPMMFFAGLWVPRQKMPSVLREIGDYTPLGSGVQAIQDAMVGHWPGVTNIVVLAAYVVVLCAVAARWFRWQ